MSHMRVLIIGTEEQFWKCVEEEHCEDESLGYDYLNPYLKFQKQQLIGFHPEEDALAYEVIDCRKAPKYEIVYSYEKYQKDKYERNRYYDVFKSLPPEQWFTLCEGHL